jgi:hypothetical protein
MRFACDEYLAGQIAGYILVKIKLSLSFFLKRKPKLQIN